MKGVLHFLRTILLLFVFLIGIFVYEVAWKVETVDKSFSTVDESFSEDTVYELLFQSIGEPGWPFGSTPGRLVLKKEGRTISSTRFEISDDGSSLRKELWQVVWHTDHVEIILSGSEQRDEQFLLYFDGTVETFRLETTGGTKCEYNYAVLKEKGKEVRR